jgi:hypothetical protein
MDKLIYMYSFLKWGSGIDLLPHFYRIKFNTIYDDLIFRIMLAITTNSAVSIIFFSCHICKEENSRRNRRADDVCTGFFITFLFNIMHFFSFLPLEGRNRIVQIVLDSYTYFSLQPSIIQVKVKMISQSTSYQIKAREKLDLWV